jgi:hypothetical protein
MRARRSLERRSPVQEIKCFLAAVAMMAFMKQTQFSERTLQDSQLARIVIDD